MKKYLSIILAVLVAASALAGCAGQANMPEQSMVSNTNAPSGTPEKEDIPDDSFSKEDYQKLLDLQFDDYRHMRISEFQNKVWEMIDMPEYMELLERFSKSETLYQMKDSNEIAWFLFYILEPLTAESWQTRTYSGAAESDLPAPAENARLEYNYTLTILAADKVMVKDYNDMRLGVLDMMQDILRNRTKAELQNETLILTEVKTYVDEMLPYMQTPEVSVAIEYAYFPLPAENDNHANEYLNGNVEQRRYPNGTEEDYRSLLALKTADYANTSVADFNAKLLAWADEDFNRMERIDADIQWNDFCVDLSEEEQSFVQLTVLLSGIENGEFVQSNYTGEPETDPAHHQNLPQKLEINNQQPIWCDFSYQYSYHIADKKVLTVGERDRCVGGMINAVQKFWDETPLNDLLTMTKSDITSLLTSLAAEYSNDAITITINTEQVHFEHTDERIEMA